MHAFCVMNCEFNFCLASLFVCLFFFQINLASYFVQFFAPTRYIHVICSMYMYVCTLVGKKIMLCHIISHLMDVDGFSVCLSLP